MFSFVNYLSLDKRMHQNSFFHHLTLQDEYLFYSIQKPHEMIHVTNEMIGTNKITLTSQGICL